MMYIKCVKITLTKKITQRELFISFKIRQAGKIVTVVSHQLQQ